METNIHSTAQHTLSLQLDLLSLFKHLWSSIPIITDTESFCEDFRLGRGKWWIGESELDNGVDQEAVSPDMMDPCLIILAWSLCDRLSPDTSVLAWLNSALLFILNVGTLLSCNGRQAGVQG